MEIIKMNINAKYVRKLLHYNPTTGDFFHRINRGKVKCGVRSGAFDGRYIRIGIDGRTYLAHRLA